MASIQNARFSAVVFLFGIFAWFCGTADAQMPDFSKLKDAVKSVMPDQAAKSDTGKTTSQVAGCGVGAIGGGFIAKALAKKDASRLGLSSTEAKSRERGYIVGLALLGCGAGSAVAGTVYAKLSDAGKRAREQELMEAAKSAQIRTYKDPENPNLNGRVTPGPVYADSSIRECRDIEDVLADADKGEPMVVKYCRSVPDGGWAPATV
jgi:hypothetical protein